jgi:hypothetical protein
MPGIYLRHGDSYIAMTGQAYESESVLQALIAQHPEILAGEDPGRPDLLLVKQEAPIEPEQDSGLSLDHLYLDARGVPTLVEVKQGANRELRRQVVGQLLDYAANARRSLSVERMQEWLEEAADESSITAEAVLAERLGVEDADDFWSLVATNLDAEEFRLVFVSDQIPPSLRRIIEFLNEHMNIDVLGIEVSQYTDSTRTQQIIVPRFVGESEAARQTKRSRGRSRSQRILNREELLASFDADSDDRAAVVALLDGAAEQPDLELTWTLAANIGNPRVGVPRLVRIWPSWKDRGPLQVNLRVLRGDFGWDTERCNQLIRRLEASADLTFDDGRTWPTAPIVPLADPHNREAFFEVINEVVRSLSPPPQG